MKKTDVLFYSALICALWFALTSWAWTYFMNLVISLPFGIAAFFLWKAGTNIEGKSKRFSIVDKILLIGTCSAFVVLIWILLFD